MSTPFIGQIQAFAFGIVPRGWSQCAGQLLNINSNQALFALLGTVYGGDGVTTFGLPDLRGRFTNHVGSGFALGQKAGEEGHTLLVSEMPPHFHSVVGSSSAAALPSASNNYPAVPARATYGSSPNTTLGTGSSAAGGSQPHPNQPPYLALNYCIALQGIFPSRN